MTVAPDKVKKYLGVRALAESGIAGERANATRTLREMEEKYPGIKEAAEHYIREHAPKGTNPSQPLPETLWARLGIDLDTVLREGGKLLFGMLAAMATGPDRDVERVLAKIKAGLDDGGTKKRPVIELVISIPESVLVDAVDGLSDEQHTAIGAALGAMAVELYKDACLSVQEEDDEDEETGDEDSRDEDSEDEESA